MKASCDIDCGSYYKDHVKHAVEKEAIQEKEVDSCTRIVGASPLALVNLIKVQMRLGLFDPAESQVYTQYGLDRLNTPDHKALSLRAAREGIVLLKNHNHKLPVAAEQADKVMVTGPFAEDTDVMLGNYEGVPEHIVSLAEGLKSVRPATTAVHVQ